MRCLSQNLIWLLAATGQTKVSSTPSVDVSSSWEKVTSCGPWIRGVFCLFTRKMCHVFSPAGRRNILGSYRSDLKPWWTTSYSLCMDGPQKFGDMQIRALQFDLNIFCIEGKKRKDCTPSSSFSVFLLKQRIQRVSFSLPCKDVFC